MADRVGSSCGRRPQRLALAEPSGAQDIRLTLLERMLKDVGGIPIHGGRRPPRDAGRPDLPNPDHCRAGAASEAVVPAGMIASPSAVSIGGRQDAL
ncbi:hypothetical protein AB1L88_19405, partial [Tautonia sp. JC769]